MSEPLPRPTVEQSVSALRGNPYFNVICGELVAEREDKIGDLARYENETELRKLAADITAITNFLDRFGVPVGEPPPLS